MKTNIFTRIIFYLFGSILLLIEFLSLSDLIIPHFTYKIKTTATIVDIENNYSSRLNSQYITLEYYKDNVITTGRIYRNSINNSISVGDTFNIKYSSDNTYDIYCPKLEFTYNYIYTSFVLLSLSIICFIAPSNSNKAKNLLNKFQTKLNR